MSNLVEIRNKYQNTETGINRLFIDDINLQSIFSVKTIICMVIRHQLSKSTFNFLDLDSPMLWKIPLDSGLLGFTSRYLPIERQ